MKLIDNILVGVDFRDSTDKMVENAIAFAKKFKAKITLIHVLPDDIKNQKISDFVTKAAKEKLSMLNVHIQRSGVATEEPILKFGNYSERVAYAANEVHANLIMVGEGEKPRSANYRLGTTTSKIIRESSKPVLVIKQGQDLEKINKILCPVDFSDESNQALNNAIAVAKVYKADLVILSVYNKFNNTGVTRIDEDEVNAQRKREQELALEEFIEKQNLVNVNYSSVILGGDPAKQILEYIKNNEVDFLLMGTTGKSGISKILMGSVAEKVTREVVCSFITSKKENFLDFELKAKDVQEYYDSAESMFNNGFYEPAIDMYNAALDLNFSHVPSLRGLAKAYDKLGDAKKVNKYKGMIKDVLAQFENFKIEEEIRHNLNK